MNTFLRIGKYIGGIILAFALMIILPPKIVAWFNLGDSPSAELIYLLVIVAVIVLAIIAFGQKKVFAFSPKSFGATFIVGGVMTLITAYYLITNIYTAFKEYGTPKMDGKSIVYFFISIFIAAGIREELLTRGLLLTFFRKAFGNSKKSYIVAMSLSSLMFGLMHLTNLQGATNTTPIYAQVIYATGIGFFFAALFVRTGNIWGNVVLHYLFDISLMITPIVFAGRNDLDNLIGEWLGSGIIIKSIIICAASILIGLFLIRDSKFQPILEAEANSDSISQPILDAETA